MTCASCSRTVCDCPDLAFAGIVPPSTPDCPLSLGGRGVTAGGCPPAASGDLIHDRARYREAQRGRRVAERSRVHFGGNSHAA